MAALQHGNMGYDSMANKEMTWWAGGQSAPRDPLSPDGGKPVRGFKAIELWGSEREGKTA